MQALACVSSLAVLFSTEKKRTIATAPINLVTTQPRKLSLNKLGISNSGVKIKKQSYTSGSSIIMHILSVGLARSITVKVSVVTNTDLPDSSLIFGRIAKSPD
jgi:hypothetical protein